MAARPVKDKQKESSERNQAILSELLKDEDNKYCVDCDAKGPRWASWNLGVFLCIRCAGIHRNLGVHISKVKSVNLDSWTPEQIATIEDMGNSKARAIYEANLPDGYKRPQTDSALEQFIRAKYELKKWIAKEWNPQQQQSRSQSRATDSSATPDARRHETKPPVAAASIKTSSSSSNLGAPVAAAQNASITRTTSQGLLTSASQQPQQQQQKSPANVDLLGGISADPNVQSQLPRSAGSTASSVDLLADIFGNTAPAQAVATGALGQGSSAGAMASTREDLFLAAEDKSKSQKDSIMALYGTAPAMMPPQPPAYRPGAYIAQGSTMGGAAFALPGGYQMQHPGHMAGPGMMAQSPMPVMMGMQPVPANAVMFPGMVVAPVAQAPVMMNNGMTPGFYSQQQHAYLASQQLQQQMTSLSVSNQPMVAAQPQLANGSTAWASEANATGSSSGKTLDFTLWH